MTEEDARFKILEKEVRLVKKKLERSETERKGLEVHLHSLRKLLLVSAQERLNEELMKQLAVFRKFVPQEFLHHLKIANWLDVKLGDHIEQEMTILFSDIRSFTSLSEKMSPEENFEFINNYLSYVYPPIKSQGGFVDKFIGDAVMALFNQSHNAIEAGIGMQKSLLQYNEKRAITNLVPINIGIGLHTGNLMLGVIGIEERMQGTVISDAVNLASRLESLTKHYGSSMLVSKEVLLENKDLYITRFLGYVKVHGKSEKVEIHEILAAECDEVFKKKYDSKPFFEEGLKLFYDNQFAEASVQFSLSLKVFHEDKAAKHYLQVAASYMLNGPPIDWDGTDVMEK